MGLTFMIKAAVAHVRRLERNQRKEELILSLWGIPLGFLGFVRWLGILSSFGNIRRRYFRSNAGSPSLRHEHSENTSYLPTLQENNSGNAVEEGETARPSCATNGSNVIPFWITRESAVSLSLMRRMHIVFSLALKNLKW
ncbi:hypothetical protein NA56DRAFT_746476 [Hyaloscypha hepaticicola]|uniref:Uncharacterized protein n=1 Tax=Hyaloscypha hepaticicola TaxID=2082293 RepID=A0A2J6QDI5_9HELO|nr:hypothetical protein NA56DRAFT_746476 [Hyaloscypha hepaticicola]